MKHGNDSCHSGACHAALVIGWHKLYKCCQEGLIGHCRKSCVFSTDESLHACVPHFECVVIITIENGACASSS